MESTSFGERKRKFLNLLITVVALNFFSNDMDPFQLFSFLVTVINSYEILYSPFPRIQLDFEQNAQQFWSGENVFFGMAQHPFQFLETTGETTTSF